MGTPSARATSLIAASTLIARSTAATTSMPAGVTAYPPGAALLMLGDEVPFTTIG
jgi:hypothetical protein